MTKKSNISIIRDENLPSGVGIPSVLVIVHNSDRFGEEYVKDFQASERKGLQALSASVGSYQTVARNNHIVLNASVIDNHPSTLTMSLLRFIPLTLCLEAMEQT